MLLNMIICVIVKHMANVSFASGIQTNNVPFDLVAWVRKENVGINKTLN